MNVLGITGRYRDAAAAVAVDGSLAAAASEDSFVGIAGIGYSQTGGFPRAAVEACLAKAGLTISDIDRITIVDDRDPAAAAGPANPDPPTPAWHMPKSRAEAIDPLVADAIQVAASASDVSAVLVCSTHPPGLARFARQHGQLVEHSRISGGQHLVSAARNLASILGVSADDPFGSLDRLSIGGEPEFTSEMAAALRWDRETGVSIDLVGLRHLIDAAAAQSPDQLSNAASLNTRVQSLRRSLAASFTERAARLVGDLSGLLLTENGDRHVGLGGNMTASARLKTELGTMVGERLLYAAVPERVGRALGAALSGTNPQGDALAGLTLGPVFTDYDIKRVIDNCRLDAVYEPDWGRLIERVSKMLSQGKVIGWFQGAMAFGPRPLGSRSVLCDPSGRYARQNINEYLRHGPLDEPLPIVFAPSLGSGCVLGVPASAYGVMDVAVPPEWREQLTSALDWRHHVRMQSLSPSDAPELCQLLERHYERTGVPALIETPLGGIGEPFACTPRDALRTVFSSAIDALVMGRFLLMKDYWLLRSDGA